MTKNMFFLIILMVSLTPTVIAIYWSFLLQPDRAQGTYDTIECKVPESVECSFEMPPARAQRTYDIIKYIARKRKVYYSAYNYDDLPPQNGEDDYDTFNSENNTDDN